MKFRAILLFAVICIYAPANAQYQETLNSDNPGLTMSPFTVGARTLQIESGYRFLSTDYDVLHDFSQFNSKLIETAYRNQQYALKARVGLFNRLDASFQFRYDQVRNKRNPDESFFTSGDYDTRVYRAGLKGAIYQSDGIVPSLGAEVAWQRVYGLEWLTFIFSGQSQLTPKFALRGNLGSDFDFLHGGVNLTYQPIEKLSVFAEYSGFLGTYGWGYIGIPVDYFPTTNVTSGLTFLASPNWLLDVSGSYVFEQLIGHEVQSETFNSYALRVGLTGRFDWRKN